jgi:hypothetical protein
MALKDTINQMRRQLADICYDLEKAAEGNKTASQRVRTNTVSFAKLAKVFRKESLASEKSSHQPRKKLKA